MKLAALVLGFALAASAHAFTSDDILKVRPGMNIKEVKAILGGPQLMSPASKQYLGLATKNANPDLTEWAYKDDATKRTVIVTYDTSASVLKSQSKWKVVDVSAWSECLSEAVLKASLKIAATAEEVKTALGPACGHFKVSKTTTAQGTVEEWASADKKVSLTFSADGKLAILKQ